jgi:uncharacterized phage-associated protein
MTVTAPDVAAVLRERLPGLPTKKLHKLLYYCQGHHLATFGSPLFSESIAAWDMGPVVGQLWHAEKEEGVSAGRGHLGEAELNTIGYVVSRYGALTGSDLENLTHSEEPWQRADSSRRPRGSVRIRQEWLTDYFRTRGAADTEDEDAPLDSAAVTDWLSGALGRRADQLRADSPEELRARLPRGA